MTFVVCAKVNDGIVMAADSATTMSNQNGVLNVYNNANKLFSLVRHERTPLPIGALTYGAGNIGNDSIATIAKDFRKCSDDTASPYYIDSANYTVEEVADKFKKFVFDDRYDKVFTDPDPANRPDIGFYVAGYPSKGSESKVFGMSMNFGVFNGVNDLSFQPLLMGGQPEAITRLVYGVTGNIENLLRTKLNAMNVQISDQQVSELVVDVVNNSVVPIVIQAMPIQDLIDLVNFLMDATIQFVRFAPGDNTVGGPIETAAITEYEGFKWVKRKHYYSAALNS